MTCYVSPNSHPIATQKDYEMSGSLNHLIGNDGHLTFDAIDGLKDAGMALRQCYNIIAVLCNGDMATVSAACEQLGYVDPYRVTGRFDDEPMPAAMQISDT